MVFYLAAILLVIVGAAHSLLGERLLISRLAALEALPHLRGSREYTLRLVRVAWHITTVAWAGFAAIFVLAANDALTRPGVLTVICATFAVSGLTALIASRGRHLSWIVFLAVGALALYGAAI